MLLHPRVSSLPRACLPSTPAACLLNAPTSPAPLPSPSASCATTAPCLEGCASVDAPIAAGFKRLTAAGGAAYYGGAEPPCGATSAAAGALPAGAVFWHTGKQAPSVCAPTQEDRCYMRIQLVGADWGHSGTKYWLPSCASAASQASAP